MIGRHVYMNKSNTEMLYEAILTLKTVDECRAFFTDLCTIMEISSMSQRLEVARLLNKKIVYNKIAEETGASSATISRVNRCLNHGEGGYKLVLGRLQDE
jgi:TrpR-related protein YerC/YecD